MARRPNEESPVHPHALEHLLSILAGQRGVKPGLAFVAVLPGHGAAQDLLEPGRTQRSLLVVLHQLVNRIEEGLVSEEVLGAATLRFGVNAYMVELAISPRTMTGKLRAKSK